MASEIRQRRSKNENGSAFSQHVEQDTTLSDTRKTVEGPKTPTPKMSLRARILVFLAFPMCIGSAGLCLGYISTFHDKSRSVDFGRDFVAPFLMAVVLAVVIIIRRKCFTSPMAPLLRLPEAQPRKKIVRKQVTVDDDGNEISPKED